MKKLGVLFLSLSLSPIIAGCKADLPDSAESPNEETETTTESEQTASQPQTPPATPPVPPAVDDVPPAVDKPIEDDPAETVAELPDISKFCANFSVNLLPGGKAKVTGTFNIGRSADMGPPPSIELAEKHNFTVSINGTTAIRLEKAVHDFTGPDNVHRKNVSYSKELDASWGDTFKLSFTHDNGTEYTITDTIVAAQEFDSPAQDTVLANGATQLVTWTRSDDSYTYAVSVDKNGDGTIDTSTMAGSGREYWGGGGPSNGTHNLTGTFTEHSHTGQITGIFTLKLEKKLDMSSSAFDPGSSVISRGSSNLNLKIDP